MTTNAQSDEISNDGFVVSFYKYLAKVISFVFGFIFSMIILIIVYGSEATTKLLKGISVQNIISALTTGNISELLIMVYFILIFLITFFLIRVARKKFFVDNQSKREFLTSIIGSFREGSFTLPFFIMIAFPLVLQVVLPGLIILVAIFEILLMFMIVGEIWNVSRTHFMESVHTIRKDGRPILKLKKLAGYIPITLLYPVFVFILNDSGLDKFLSLVHYNILWNNPDSTIAGIYWGFIDSIISAVSFGNLAFIQFLDSIKYFINTFIVLIVISEIYLFLRVFTRRELGKFIDHHVLIYD